MLREIVVKKITKLHNVARIFRSLAIYSLIYGVIGILLYIAFARSNIILIDSILWVVDSILYLTLSIILKIISIKTVNSYRYELLRVEDILSLIISIITIAITVSLIPSAISNTEITPPPFTLYLVGSASLSYIFSKHVQRNNLYGKIIISATALKTWIDTIIELVSATTILISYALGTALLENLAFIAVSIYAINCSLSMVWKSILNLLDVNYPKDLKYRVNDIVRKYDGIQMRKVLIRNLGSFVEVELWVAFPSNLTLVSAQYVISRIAKEVVVRIPEVIKVLIIAVPKLQKIEHDAEIKPLNNTIKGIPISSKFNP
ncbi:MAG: cation transporter [Sulfolobales archaeon]